MNCPATREAVQELEEQGGECLICGRPANRHPPEQRLPAGTHPWHCTDCHADLPTDLGHRPGGCPICGNNNLKHR
jgi:rRNA maturation endonuclease Nob1